jgi:hypothetical protein
MELKVQCACGQKYRFDVEPVSGQMPFTVNCPVCGVDGTASANTILREILTTSAVPDPVPTGRLALASAAAPSATAAAIAPPPPPPVAAPGASRLRINKAPAEAPAAEPGPAETHTTAPAAPAPRVFQRSAPAAAEPKPAGSFAKGLLGAFLGALIGSAIYFAIFNYSGLRLRILAIGVAFLAGLGGRLLGKEGSHELGAITATLALLGVFGAQYFVAWNMWHEADSKKKPAATYESSVAEAKDVIAAVPTGSDQEIRVYLAKQNAAEMNGKPDTASVEADDIKDFREEELPHYRDLAGGKITKEQFEAEAKVAETAAKAEKDESEGTFKWYFMLLCLTRANIFSMCAAAALAYKMTTDA